MLYAVHQKLAKNYASGTPAVLIVQLYSPLPLMRFELERIATAIRAMGSRFKFAALWIVNDYGDPPALVRRAVAHDVYVRRHDGPRRARWIGERASNGAGAFLRAWGWGVGTERRVRLRNDGCRLAQCGSRDRGLRAHGRRSAGSAGADADGESQH